MIAVRFLEDRGPRRKGQTVRYDDNSAAAIVESGAAEYVDAPDAAAVAPKSTGTAEPAVADTPAPAGREKAVRRDTAAKPPESDPGA